MSSFRSVPVILSVLSDHSPVGSVNITDGQLPRAGDILLMVEAGSPYQKYFEVKYILWENSTLEKSGIVELYPSRIVVKKQS